MQKHLLILTTLLLTLKVGHGQTNVYHPFPDSSVVWIGTAWHNEGGSGPCVIYNDYNLYISGDTTIGSLVYHKLYENGFDWASCPPPGQYHYGAYSGAFRQDTANKKIYLFRDGVDTLAYDFNLNIGDTLPKSCLNVLSNNYIQSIDSVLVGSQYRKRFWISEGSNSNYTALIEGVGSTLGAFDFIVPFFENGTNLWCLRINNQISWTYSQDYNCGLTAVAENSVIANKILISQNPFSTETTLNFISNLKNAILTVYNTSGQLVKQIKNISGQTCTFNRDNLMSGLYFLRLTQDNTIFATNKLVITDN